MKVTQLTPYLIQLSQHFPFPLNVYLVHEMDGLTLVDTGFPGTFRGIVQALETQSAPLRRIVLTHAHEDHAGSLEALHHSFPQAELLVGVREAPLLAGDLRLEPSEAAHRLKGNYRGAGVRPTHLLEPGDRVGSLEVIDAKGHTPGQIALLDRRDRSLVVGDAFSSVGGLAVSSTPFWRFPFPAWATWNPGLALETAERLCALEPSLVAPGHGPALNRPQQAMTRAVGRVERIGRSSDQAVL